MKKISIRQSFEIVLVFMILGLGGCVGNGENGTETENGYMTVVPAAADNTTTDENNDTTPSTPENNDTTSTTPENNDTSPSTPGNSAPAATAQSVTTNEDSSKTITLTGTDAEGDTLTYSVTVVPSHGMLSCDGDLCTYTPASDYSGNDSFKFIVNDGTADSPEATVTITVNGVNDTPVATGQYITVDEESSDNAITLNGTDADGDTLTYTVTVHPTNGTLSGTPPNLAYTPNADYNGNDSLKFIVNDGTADSPEATVTITVNGVNDAPVATEQNITVDEDSSDNAITLSGSDIDGDPLTYILTVHPANGTLSGTPPNLTYTPYADYNGSDSLKFIINDGTVDSAEAVVSIMVNNLPDNAPKLVANTSEITEFTYSGNAGWEEDNATYYTPDGSWRNQDITHTQSACMMATVDVSNDRNLTFYYKVSCEGSFDFLRFYIDNTQMMSDSGNKTWIHSNTYGVSAGTHTLKWCYTKDSSVNSFSDTVWVDEIILEGAPHELTLAEDTPLGAVGTIEIVAQSDAAIDHFTISGTGSEHFEVSPDGTLSLVEGLDYETQTLYTLDITAYNDVGASNTVTYTIYVTDVPGY